MPAKQNFAFWFSHVAANLPGPAWDGCLRHTLQGVTPWSALPTQVAF